MTSRRFHEAVAEEVAEAFKWYEERRVGLGGQFLEAVERTMLRIEENPEQFPVVHQEIRRALVQRPFPYQIFFRLEGRYIRVYAVLHGARDPATWRRRVP